MGYSEKNMVVVVWRVQPITPGVHYEHSFFPDIRVMPHRA